MLGHGKTPSGFDRDSSHTARVEVLRDDMGRRLEASVHALGGESTLVVHIARHGRIDLRGIGIGRFADLGQRRKRLVVDVDQFDAVFGEVLALGHDHGHRLAREPHFLDCQHVSGVEAVAGQLDLSSDRLHHGGEIGAGEDVHHAVERACLAHVDRQDPCVGIGAQHEGEVQGVERRGQIVDEAALATQEVVVLSTQDTLPNSTAPDGALGVVAHGWFPRRSATAAPATASTMLA